MTPIQRFSRFLLVGILGCLAFGSGCSKSGPGGETPQNAIDKAANAVVAPLGKAKEASAIIRLTEIRLRQIRFSQDPNGGNGRFGKDLAEIGWSPGADPVGNDWEFSTDSTGAARAKASKPEGLEHPVILLLTDGSLQYPKGD